jgi:hypothetical protein
VLSEQTLPCWQVHLLVATVGLLVGFWLVVAAFAFSFWLVIAATAFFAFIATATAAATLLNLAVCDLFFSRRANFLDRHVEVEVFARERVVTIDSDIVVFDFNHTNRDRAFISVGLKLHACLKVFDALKTLLRHDLLQCRIYFAVAVFWIDAHCCSLTNELTYKGGLEAWNNVTMTVKIDHWLSRLGLVNQSSFVIFKSVVHCDYCAICYLHNL